MKRIRLTGLALAAFLLLNAFSLTVYARRYADVIYRKQNTQMKIALTFDDGPHPVYTPEILDILDEYGIKATFFVVGENVDLYPQLIEREIAEGHELGNHTYTHCHLSKTAPNTIIKEMDACERAVYEICEYRTKLFRPPEGVLPETIREYALREDYSVILWSIDTYDWAHARVSDIRKNVLKNTDAGDIILMHDYVPDSITPKALREIIPALLDKGYKFVTVSELTGSY